MKKRLPVADNKPLRVPLQTNPGKDYYAITAANGGPAAQLINMTP